MFDQSDYKWKNIFVKKNEALKYIVERLIKDRLFRTFKIFDFLKPSREFNIHYFLFTNQHIGFS